MDLTSGYSLIVKRLWTPNGRSCGKASFCNRHHTWVPLTHFLSELVAGRYYIRTYSLAWNRTCVDAMDKDEIDWLLGLCARLKKETVINMDMEYLFCIYG
jgi:hypothetical protein